MHVSDFYTMWLKVKDRPCGKWFFQRLIAAKIPYTGSIKADMEVWEKGYAKLSLKDRKSIRNHLNSIHAIALTNLGEFVTGLAMASLMPRNMRGIPINLSVDFIKKARGTLTAECKTEMPSFTKETKHSLSAEIKDASQDTVAVVRVQWQLEYHE
jgi:acyl-coenzyme A thioesterase PaaI-like protein